MPEQVHHLLRQSAATVSTAESLTGGALAAALTAVPGASATYLGGVVAYATDVKVAVLGVPEDLVERHGVISAACAIAMARGVRDLTGATYGVATTGVAGPTAQESKPVGTVYVGLCGPVSVRAVPLELVGERAAIVEASVAAALGAIADLVGEARLPG
nr:CinA family protein [Nocardioides sp.]